MSSYAKELLQRFGDDCGPTDDGVAELPFVRQVLGRKTVRAYTDAMPSDALLELLCAAALSASAKSDFQQASILRVLDPGKARRHRQAISGYALDRQPPRHFSSFLAMHGDLSASAHCAASPSPTARSRASSTRAVDAALAMQTFILAAESAGLGCCPISVIRNKIDEVAAILGLPDQVFPVAGLCVGYPARAGFVSLRLPRTVTLHRDVYDDGALADAVDDYDRRRDAIHSIPKEQQRSPDEFGVADFYGWSEDKARQAAKPEGAAFPVYLRKHGFTLD